MATSKENRRQARIQVVQNLYACEMRGVLAPRKNLQDDELFIGQEISPFAKELVEVTLDRITEVDELLSSSLQNWDLHRLGAVDRAIMRAAVAELLCHPEIPPAVTINEAIEIARSLATAESARFANGVLDSVRRKIGRESKKKL